MHAWEDLNEFGYVGLGSDQVLQLYGTSDQTLREITPVVSTSNLTGPFSTNANSTTVTVSDPNASPAAGDFIYVATSTFVGGIVLQGLYQVQSALGGNKYTITAALPATSPVTNGGTTFAFSAQAGTSVIGLSQGGATFTQGQAVTVYVSTTVGGTTLAGPYTVNIVSGNPTITASLPATTNASGSENGGAVQILYLLKPQGSQAVLGGFGQGPFGQGPFGQGVSAPQVTREWSIDNFGQVMVAAPKNGALYQWTPPVAYNNRASAVASAPQFSTAIFVAMPQEQVVSLGSHAGGFQDPMLVKFSNIGDFTSSGAWTPTATNQAGSFRLTRGSRIVGGMQASSVGLIWTDVGMWLMKYVGFPFVYSFDEIGQGAGLLATRAAAEVGGLIVWPGPKGFWFYDGNAVRPLPCKVWDFFYNPAKGGFDPGFIPSIHAGPNSDFSEIVWWFAPLGANGVPTNYVSVDIASILAGDPIWTYGTMTRTSFLDRSDVAPPLGVDGANGLIQQHETSNDANGTAMTSFAETAWFMLMDGAVKFFVERILPDFVMDSGSKVLVTVYVVDYPGDPFNTGTVTGVRQYGPFTVTQLTRYILPRCRGYMMKLHFDFSPLGTFARLGLLRAKRQPAGSV